MRKMLTKFAGICIVFVLFLAGCAREETMTAIVMYRHPTATQIKYIPGIDGLYFLCENNKLVFVETNRLFGANIIQTVVLPDNVSCTEYTSDELHR